MIDLSIDRAAMAYYDSGSYDGEIGEYHWAPYSNASNDVPYQGSITCSDFDSYEPKAIEYCPSTTYGVHPDLEFDALKPIDYYPANYRDPYISYYPHVDVNYSMYSFSVPKLIMYESVPCGKGYVLSETQHLISYSTKDSGFDDTEFVEYDPTPYGGGYDLARTYGKALSPSDEICYPPSTPEPSAIPLENISPENISSAHVEKGDVDSNARHDDKEKVDVGDPEIPLNRIDDGKQGDNDMSIIAKESDHGSDIDEPLDMKMDEDREGEYTYSEESDHGSDIDEPLDMKMDDDREGEYTYSEYGYDYPWFTYDYGNGKQVNEATPYEYNADTVDLCESIFGHWPCLARRQERINRNEDAIIIDNGNRNSNPWEGTANYLFGDPLGYGNSNYRCENYYQQQPCVVNEECYNEN